jgi:hypothetical protein
MSDWAAFLDDLEHQLDVLEASFDTTPLVEAPAAPFDAPALGPVPAVLRGRAELAHARLRAAEDRVAAELERTRNELALTERTPDPPRFLDTTC